MDDHTPLIVEASKRMASEKAAERKKGLTEYEKEAQEKAVLKDLDDRPAFWYSPLIPSPPS